MPRLRMKDTPSGVDEAVRQAQRSAQRRKRRQQRDERRRSESMTPPRRPARPDTDDDDRRGPSADTDWGFDESSVPPKQAHKRDEHLFNESLLDAQFEDEGIGYYENLMYSTQQQQKYATSFSYGSAAGRAMGLGAAGADPLTAMDDEEYAEYMRAGMWRIKNKDEIERQEAIEKERQRKLEQDRIEDERRRRKEQERLRRLEDKAKRKNEQQDKDYRQQYEDKWRKLVPSTSAAAAAAAPLATDKPTPLPSQVKTAADSTSYPLRYTDFAWPVFPPMPLPPLSWPSVDEISSSAVARFLLEPHEDDKDKRKQVLRQAVLLYHPDRFNRLIERVPEDKDDVRDRVRELGLRVSQVLNDLMKSGAR
ncbi:hypothetical protein ACM66B_004516 [Microbotryomycetes sp. NB124-2]